MVMVRDQVCVDRRHIWIFQGLNRMKIIQRGVPVADQQGNSAAYS